jgi:TetR/AcrR family transcriptional regulator, mexJK operon transcriptional repressor
MREEADTVMPSAPAVGRAVGGAGPKGEAIAAAALRLFLRDGYERTSVDAIAAEAGVSKRTIYNRYTDKENLFRSVLLDMFTEMMAVFRRIADAHLAGVAGVADVESSLTAFLRETVVTLTMAVDRVALMRLILTEAPYFPALLRQERGNEGMHAILSRVLGRLADAGKLTITDPDEASEHLFALTLGRANERSMFGGKLNDAEIDRIVTGGVRVFLCAYGPARP